MPFEYLSSQAYIMFVSYNIGLLYVLRVLCMSQSMYAHLWKLRVHVVNSIRGKLILLTG